MGSWHRGALERLAFRHEGFEIDYAPGRKRGATRNQVSWVDAQGGSHREVIGDHRPLVLDGYRIYTSPNKGFAPVLSWLPDAAPPPAAGELGASAGASSGPSTNAVRPRRRGGRPIKTVGAVHLPSYPANELRQSIQWTLPDGRSVWVKLDFDETLIDSEQVAAFRLSATGAEPAGGGDVAAPVDLVGIPDDVRHGRVLTWSDQSDLRMHHQVLRVCRQVLQAHEPDLGDRIL